MYKTIVVAVDGSAHAEKAAKTAAELAVQLKARLVLVHVLMERATVADVRVVAEIRRLPKPIRDEIEALEMPVAAAAMGAGFVALPVPRNVLKAVGDQVLERAKAIAAKARLRKVTVTMLAGDPTKAILSCVRREKADLLVVGSRGHGALKGLVLGSVSHSLAQQAKIPVVIVK
jgi:nucleotide-binding universal stress UspA family protein